jgi:hypothetical protein
MFGPPFSPSLARIVDHIAAFSDEPEAISTVWRIDGTSWNNGRPAGVALKFQVSVDSVEPILSNRRRNLLSHGDRGTLCCDEVVERRPEVPFVLLALASAGDAEGLAGA